MSVHKRSVGPHSTALGVINFSKAGAVQNTWYTAFEDTNVEVHGFAVGVTVADESLQIRATIDGVTITSDGAIACTFAANPFSSMVNRLYCVTPGTWTFTQSAAGTAGVMNTYGSTAWCKGRSVKIEVRKTTAGGASAVLGIGVYSKW